MTTPQWSRKTDYFCGAGRKERLLKRHLDAWSEIWKSNVTVEVVRTLPVTYVLPCTTFTHSPERYSIQPESYGTFRPDLQRSRILGYWTMDVSPIVVDATGDGKIISWIQVSTPGGSQKNAFPHGYKGAMFPWSPQQKAAKTTGVALPVPFSTTSPDVLGGAFWKYYQVIQRQNMAQGKGLAGAKRSSRFLGQPGRKKWARKIRYQQCDRR